MPEYVKVYLEKIEELCEKNNAQLLLVSMPSPKIGIINGMQRYRNMRMEKESHIWI